MTSMSPLHAEFAKRTADRRAAALPRALRALEELERIGIRAWAIGSLARGRFHAQSDVDIAVDCDKAREREAFTVIEKAMRDFPFHMLPCRRIKEDALAFIMEGALDASGLRCNATPTARAS
jgi:predicted nucleotidyltransferase